MSSMGHGVRKCFHISGARSALALGSALLGLACDDPLALPQRIERTRVLAARVELDTDPSRAWPGPGEAATVRWLVVDPDPNVGFTWDLRACVATASAVGLASCAVAPFATLRSESELESPTFPFVVPADEGSKDEIVLVHGVICSRGVPASDATGCLGERADGDRVALSIPIAETSNGNPFLGDDTILFGGLDWQAPVSEAEGCAALPGSRALPRVRPGERRTIELTLRGGDRERIDPGKLSYGSGGGWETLQVAHAATSGMLDRPFSYLESDPPADGERLSVGWTAPSSVPEDGIRVRFYMIVRDLRGGSDWARRDVCVVP